MALIYSARPQEGMEYLRTAIKLDPHNPGPYLARIGLAHFCMGEWQEAVTASEKAMKINPDIAMAPAVLASGYAHLGRDEEAKAVHIKLFTSAWGPTLQRIFGHSKIDEYGILLLRAS
jgi:tetratricopeptide (TPR) repeat protein